MMRFFHTRALREKAMLVLLAWVLVFIWLFYYIEGVGVFRKEMKETAALQEYQDVWMDNKESIDMRLKDALKRIDPAKALNRGQFIARIDGIARGIGANYDVSSPKTRAAGIFDEHELSVSFQDASISDLLKFSQAIREEPPNLFIQEVKITPNRRDPSKLRARFDVISVELKDFAGVPGISNG